MDKLAESLAERLGNPMPERLEFHGNPIRKGDRWWRKMGQAERRKVIVDALQAALTLRGEWELTFRYSLIQRLPAAYSMQTS